jgi:hypothetical protein
MFLPEVVWPPETAAVVFLRWTLGVVPLQVVYQA